MKRHHAKNCVCAVTQIVGNVQRVAKTINGARKPLKANFKNNYYHRRLPTILILNDRAVKYMEQLVLSVKPTALLPK